MHFLDSYRSWYFHILYSILLYCITALNASKQQVSDVLMRQQNSERLYSKKDWTGGTNIPYCKNSVFLRKNLFLTVWIRWMIVGRLFFFSQNHSHWGWNRPMETILFNSSATADFLQERIQAHLEYLQKTGFQNLSGQTLPMISHSQSKGFSYVHVELPVFQSVQLRVHSVAGYCWQEPGTIHLAFVL